MFRNRMLSALLVAVLFSAGQIARAAVVVNYDTDVASDNLGPYTVSNSDLLQTALAPGGVSSSGDFTYGGNAGGVPVLTDGLFLNSGSQFEQTALPDSGSSITFTLGNPLGYRITGINTYSGWDAYLGGQYYTVAYDTVAAPDVYVDIASPRVDMDDVPGNGSSRVIITDPSGTIATSVRSLRFSFTAFNAGPSGVRELDVFGVAVPEPASVALGGMALIGLLIVARHRHAK